MATRKTSGGPSSRSTVSWRQHYNAEQQQRAALQADLDHANGVVAQLKEQLQRMGVDIEALNVQIEQTGSQNKGARQEPRGNDAGARRVQEPRGAARADRARFEQLRDKLKKLTELGLKVEIRRNRMVIRLPGDVLFASGEDKLRPEGIQVLDAVAEVIRNDKQLAGRCFQVAGHTDNKPLAGGRFTDNWGLSVMRRAGRARVPGRAGRIEGRAAAASIQSACTPRATARPTRSCAMTPTRAASRTAASSWC